jgi:hypothetical protein
MSGLTATNFQVTIKLVPEFKSLDEKGGEEKKKEEIPAPKEKPKP